MDQRLHKRLRKEVEESFLRHIQRMEEDPPQVPVRAFVVVCTEKSAEWLEQSIYAVSLEQEAESVIYRAFRDCLEEAKHTPLENRLRKLADELESVCNQIRNTRKTHDKPRSKKV